MKDKAVYIWSEIKRLLLNNGYCLICEQSTSAEDICAACKADLPWNNAACTLCALPLPGGQPICGSCLANPPPYRCLTALRYAFPVDRQLARLKYHGQLTPSRVLGQLLANRNWPADIPRPDLLLPMPLHAGRLRERGYNQATELARPLAKRLKLPLEHALVTRHKATTMQKGLSAAERQHNLRNAFQFDSARYEALGKPRHVLVIDDVVTTGATLHSLTKTLVKGGVERVDVLALCRAG